MPTTITPANGFDTATAITRAAPGERVGMETGASPLAPLLQRLADHDHTLRLGLLGQMAGGDRMSVDPGGTSTVFAVRVSQIRSVLIQQPSGPWRALSTTGETVLTIADVDGAPANLGSDEWYYVYAFAAGDATARLFITTLPPDDALVWEATSPGLRRYVGCFRTNGSGAPLPMRMHRGRYTYRMSRIGFGGYLSKTTFTTSFVAYDFSMGLPPHARIATVRVLAVDGTNPPLVNVRTPGDTTDVYVTQSPGTNAFGVFDVETNSSQDLEVQLGNATGAAASFVDVIGFSE